MDRQECEVLVIGAGIAGIATAEALSARGVLNIVVLDMGAPMALTSAQSGENYRNWWPHPAMTRFTDASIAIMERLAADTGNAIRLTRRGYVLATRRERPDDLIAELHRGYGESGPDAIRLVGPREAQDYRPPGEDWRAAPTGVDVLLDRDLIRRTFPQFDPDVSTVLHIRRAGDLSGQQLGQLLLERARNRGARLVAGRLHGLAHSGNGFDAAVDGRDGPCTLRAAQLVNAAGPFIGEVAAMLGETLPVTHVLQQKIAFEDTARTVPRDAPFAIDLDGQTIAWDDETRAALAEDPDHAWLTRPMPGSIHCRPDGGVNGRWIKLGWAYNVTPSAPTETPALDDRFPEIVLRGAARLQPRLAAYIGDLPRRMSHYGGFYTQTEENWPLIGPMATHGAFVVGALSGFGTMAACAAGEACAEQVMGRPAPDYARDFTLDRYADPDRLAAVRALGGGAL